ncbi:MAG: septum site-determining protein MinC [Proteobacteria bacterium]|nr:septum site-determining protein MinC [Pseudomonadota bacterium]
MSTQATLSKNTTTIALKGGMFTLTTIQLLEYDLEALSAELDEKINQAPNFFLYAPIILDLQRISRQEEMIELAAVVDVLKTKKLIPIGIRGANKTYKELAIEAGLAIFPEEKIIVSKKRTATEDPKLTEKISASTSVSRQESTHTATRLITQPVRSGQQIYAQGGDLIVLASVSHGAELLADGHIHVYGPLRGRALAGVMGDKDAMIFCRSLEAELVSIAGQYRLSEDLKETCWKQPACIQLQEERLHIKPV